MDRSKKYFIADFISIKNEKIFRGNEQFFSSEPDLGLHQFLKEAYKKLEINYPKYHKMDALCKLGTLGASVLFKHQSIELNTALVFSNASSSQEIDLKHQDSLSNIVSPAVFVYTLPNIILGEISIKYKLQSENVFFIEKKFNPELLFNYSEILLKTNKAFNVVCGWIELKNDEYDVFLCLVSKEGNIPFTKEKLEELYSFENE